MTHRARTDIGAVVAEHPITLGGGQPPFPLKGRAAGKIAVGAMRCVVRFDSEFATGETDPKWSVGIGAGQGNASGDKAPARYPRMRTDRGRGVSTESRGLCCPIMWLNVAAPSDISNSFAVGEIMAVMSGKFSGADF